MWSVGAETPDDCPVTGEEIRALSCLLPRKKKLGKLYPAPRGIARHLVLSAQAVEPSAPTPESIPPKNEKNGKYVNPPRQCYADDRLTHSFAPIGSHTTVVRKEKEAEMDVDEETEKKLQVEEEEVPSKKSKSKKRKGVEEAPAPKKKKSKVSA